jgi:hypothetical protein
MIISGILTWSIGCLLGSAEYLSASYILPRIPALIFCDFILSFLGILCILFGSWKLRIPSHPFVPSIGRNALIIIGCSLLMFLSLYTYAFPMILEAYRLGIPIGPDGLIQGLIGGPGFFLLVGIRE